MIGNDLTFFTNDSNGTLLDRFNRVLKNNTQFFDVLVGYFRTSGFYKLYESMEKVKKIRILVGINTDQKAVELINFSTSNNGIDMSFSDIKKEYNNKIKTEYEYSEDIKEVEEGAKKFIEFLRTGRMEIRIYPHAPIHAKVYIMRKDPERSDNFGSVITGSSNFSVSGLVNNLEFNVELKDSRDVRFALERFEELWSKSIEITDEYINTIENDTWIKEDVSPFELFLKFLYEYFKEEINEDKENQEGIFLPDGFLKLQYQEDAVKRAKKILDAYGGVFISDVVGLGKTYICAMLAQRLKKGKKLVICPPVLKDYWERVLLDFDVPAKVESLGKLDSILNEDLDGYKYVFIDEAHRFRNQSTENYEKLHQICFKKQVVLISATPQNNNINDIANLIYLFQEKRNSTIIPNVKNIENFFVKLNRRLDKHEKNSSEYNDTQKENSAEIRDKVLHNIMVRRTRHEVIKYYGKDLEKQGLSFPKLNNPKRLVYRFENDVEEIFNITMNTIKILNYARYKSLIYLKNSEAPEFATLLVGQKNLSGFMKSLLVKRLESSFYAFKNSLGRFILSYEKFIEMYHSGTVYISKKVNVYDLLDSGDDEKLLEHIENNNIQVFNSSEFNNHFIEDLLADLKMLTKVKKLWDDIDDDPKLNDFIKYLKTNPILKDNKIIIFSESKETVEYLHNELEKVERGKVISYSGESSQNLRKIIEANFNPNYKKSQQKDECRVLVTTDVLAEGINLHRSNVIINYDLPWNPTKIMQRVGRVNRVGTQHEELHVFNFFPTDQSKEHLSLEDNITAKIQSFHDTLGEDFKYLSEEEEVTSHHIFGKDFFEKITNLDSFEEEEIETFSELKYLEILRDIRNNDLDLFEKIKKLPKKVKSSKDYEKVNKEAVLTFFRKGALKKFFITDNQGLASELRLDEVIKILECDPETPMIPIRDAYYNLLSKNKEQFLFAITDSGTDELTVPKRTRSDSQVIKLIKSIIRSKRFTDIEEIKLRKLLELWDNGVIPNTITKDVIKETKGLTDPIKVFKIISDIVPDEYLNYENREHNSLSGDAEVILSCYLKNGGFEG